MRTNPERRAALLDAAIEVLAREGARGLTFRAVDKEAAVPAGPAGDYLANPDARMSQTRRRVYQRHEPGGGLVGLRLTRLLVVADADLRR